MQDPMSTNRDREERALEAVIVLCVRPGLLEAWEERERKERDLRDLERILGPGWRNDVMETIRKLEEHQT